MEKGNSQVPSKRLSTLQQERSRTTRRKLVEAAIRLWANQGFDDTPVREVCEIAGVSKGTFYFYFRRKEDLLFELAVATSERAWADWERIGAEEPTLAGALYGVVQSIARRTERTPRALLARTVREILSSDGAWREARGARKDLNAVFLAIFARARDRREISADLELTELAGIQTLVMLQGMLVWARRGHAPLGDVLWNRTRTVLNGVAVSAS